ncbi:MAG: SRPBCC family protein [Gemmatimonadetes bacterium]|nr:SRPBCC family protein [Gemmatimonadota bacterium]
MQVQRSIEISARPDAVWPFLTEPAKILQWCITFRKFEYAVEQRSGVGTRLYVEEKAGGPLMKLNFTITDWSENERVAFRMTSGTFVKAYEQSWTIQATPSGRFTFAENAEMPFGVLGKLLGLVGERQSKATVGKMLAKLKTLAQA